MKRKLLCSFTVLLMTLTIFMGNVHADYYTSNILLREGTTSTEVSNLQKDLARLGYFHVSPTGYFGNLTLQSVLAFQKDNNLVADGIVGHNTARELMIEKVIKTASSYIGVPYVWGGTSPSGFDCSGFTHYSMLANGVVIPRTAALQYGVGIPVAKNKLQRGDLVFFSTYTSGASHVGIYLGNGQFIQASSGAGKVLISQLSNVYYSQHYYGAKRVIN
jgi:cell wall-associated NlpC family hydrolase